MSTYSAALIPRPQLNARLVQNVLLIWLDQNIDENNADCCNTIKQLRRVVNSVNTFTDRDQCVDFLTDIDKENVCIIISGTLCQDIVPFIHDIAQLHSILIFCGNNKYHEQWVKNWSKIRGVFTEVSPICEALEHAAQECEHNSISISFIATGDGLKKNLDQLDPSFMYMQIMKEILLDITFEPKHFQQYVNYCHNVFAKNEYKLKSIKKFEEKYRHETPIWWYTLQSFLYPMLNHALRMTDVDIIIKMGFFMKDLHHHIEQLHKEQFNAVESNQKFVVYRGQGMSKIEFEHLTQTKGGLIAFNHFLSTSKNRTISLTFTHGALTNRDLFGVLFIMNIDPSQSTTAFASIDDVSAMPGEDEVLFTMQTVFRIGTITPMDGNPRLFQVELTLTGDDDKDLRQLTDYIRKETCPDEEGWLRLGEVLRRMGQFDKSEEVYQILLEQTTNESKMAPIYGQIGLAKYSQGEYKEAITFYEKAMEIYKKDLPSNNLNLAKSYMNIGNVYFNMGEYSKALSYNEKSLKIKQQSLPPNHPNLAASYMNIGSVYFNMGEYSKALSSHEKSLEIKQQSLPPNHPDLATSYNNIGEVYRTMGEYSKALSYYKKSLEIQQQSLPPNHPDLAASCMNIGIVYFNMGEYSKALSYYEKSLEIRQQSLRPNHPDLAASYNNIGLVYRNMGEYSKSLSSHEKSLEIQQQSLPPNHPDLAASYTNIGSVYFNMGEYYKAVSYYEKSLEIKQQSLPPNHPALARSYMNIGCAYFNMGEYSKALSYNEKSLEIRQQSLPRNHPDLAMSSYNIGFLYENMRNYSKARSYYERAVNIGQQSLPSHHPHLQVYKEQFENIKKKL